MKDKLLSVSEASALIKEGKLLVISGEEELLAQLPKGNWIGGTIPYFYLKGKAGVFDQQNVYVRDLTNHATKFNIKTYSAEDIDQIAVNGYDNGFQVLIIPAYKKIHQDFALHSDEYDKIYDNPLIGVVAGVSLEDLGKGRHTKTFNGQTGESYTESGVAIHASIPDNKVARLEIINVFEPNENGPTLEFDEDSFKTKTCLIDGEKRNLYEYIKENNIDIKFPLVCDYAGANINVSFESLKDEDKMVTFYAPLFKGNKYKFALPIDNYAEAFKKRVAELGEDRDKMIYNCNCILNYLYGDLENNDIGYSGPTAFGEIAYNLVNQTFTYLVFDE